MRTSGETEFESQTPEKDSSLLFPWKSKKKGGRLPCIWRELYTHYQTLRGEGSWVWLNLTESQKTTARPLKDGKHLAGVCMIVRGVTYGLQDEVRGILD